MQSEREIAERVEEARARAEQARQKRAPQEACSSNGSRYETTSQERNAWGREPSGSQTPPCERWKKVKPPPVKVLRPPPRRARSLPRTRAAPAAPDTAGSTEVDDELERAWLQ